ncbi:nitroreductase family protein [Halalkalibacter nanhaiisediminis]|uniref:Nitroreductase n=1 Tax=Halalkalibacter nanhaiisediminis TaxID=688079 RepID=A0A562QR84_9BACI|nr:nitroreductase family protein [Halalkalibacter nanhaiisediminis]TWI59217.1 nitroreductase [Halalkalibacter nanhaiisediminis]
MSSTTHFEEIGLFQTMEERHSVRKYEKDVKISKEELEEMLAAAATAPSSWNLQHWRFFVIEDQKKKEELLPIAYNQQQIVDSSVVVAILGDLEANKEADGVYQPAVDNGFMTAQVKDTLVGQINGAYQGEGTFPRDEAFLNPALAAMQLMLAAKAKGYDTVPMGGFNRKAFMETFKVPERFVPVMLLPIGKAASPAHRSARKAIEEVTIYNSFE